MRVSGLTLVAAGVLAVAGCSDDGGGSASDDVTLNECKGEAGTYHEAKLTVSNGSSSAADYEIAVAFLSADSGNQLQTGVARVTALAAGQSIAATARNPELFGVAATCEIVDVARIAR